MVAGAHKMSMAATCALTHFLSIILTGQWFVVDEQAFARCFTFTDEMTLFSTPEAAFVIVVVRWRLLSASIGLTPQASPRGLVSSFGSATLSLSGIATTCGFLPLRKRPARLIALHVCYSHGRSLIVAQQVRLCGRCQIGFCATDQLMHLCACMLIALATR